MVLRKYTIISLNIHICYSNRAYLHNYCRCVYYYFINFFSHLCSHQSLFPHILSKLPNHLSIPTTTTHDIPITKSTKNKEKSNQKSIQTQNQTFNKKPINPNPNSNQSRRHHCHGELAAFFARGELATAIREERNKCLRAMTKGKIKKKKKKKEKEKKRTDRGRGSREKMWFCEIKNEKIKERARCFSGGC